MQLIIIKWFIYKLQHGAPWNEYIQLMTPFSNPSSFMINGSFNLLSTSFWRIKTTNVFSVQDRERHNSHLLYLFWETESCSNPLSSSLSIHSSLCISPVMGFANFMLAATSPLRLFNFALIVFTSILTILQLETRSKVPVILCSISPSTSRIMLSALPQSLVQDGKASLSVTLLFASRVIFWVHLDVTDWLRPPALNVALWGVSAADVDPLKMHDSVLSVFAFLTKAVDSVRQACFLFFSKNFSICWMTSEKIHKES